MNFKINWDALGVATSLACAIHCALLPLLLTSLPIFGINIIHNVVFEYMMILLAFVIGIMALWHGFRKHHHSFWPILLFTTGIILLLAKQYFTQWHIPLLFAAVTAVVSAHIINYRLCRKANHCHKDDCNH